MARVMALARAIPNTSAIATRRIPMNAVPPPFVRPRSSRRGWRGQHVIPDIPVTGARMPQDASAGQSCGPIQVPIVQSQSVLVK